LSLKVEERYLLSLLAVRYSLLAARHALFAAFRPQR
jgi:hypothetical protein